MHLVWYFRFRFVHVSYAYMKCSVGQVVHYYVSREKILFPYRLLVEVDGHKSWKWEVKKLFRLNVEMTAGRTDRMGE